MLTGLFWGAVDSFAGLFDGFYYISTGESTSKADKFDIFWSMKILNTSLTQKSPEIRTKRSEQEQTLQTKKGAIGRPWRMRVGGRLKKSKKNRPDGRDASRWYGRLHV